jgi:hypothetical protein
VNYEGGEAVRETLPGINSFPPPPPLPGARAPGGGGGGGGGSGDDSDSSRDRKRKRKDEKKEKKEKKKLVRPLSGSLPACAPLSCTGASCSFRTSSRRRV